MDNISKANQIILDNEDLVELCVDRFACGCWGKEYDIYFPSSAADFLAWIEDEIEIQKDMNPQELEFITYASKVSSDLRGCGITPAVNRLPWNV